MIKVCARNFKYGQDFMSAFEKDRLDWENGEPFVVCGGDVLPKGAKIRKGDFKTETIHLSYNKDCAADFILYPEF